LLAVAATKLYRGLEAASGAITATDEMGKSVFYYEKELNDRFLGVVT